MRFLLALAAIATAFAQGPAQDGATHADWPHYGGTQLSWRYGALDQVNTATLDGEAMPAWIVSQGKTRALFKRDSRLLAGGG